MKLTIGFSCAPSMPFSWLIRWVTRSKVSHAFVVLDTPTNKLIYQASGLAVNYQNVSSFLEKEVPLEFYEFDISDEQAQANLAFRVATVGKPYGLKEIFGFGVVLLARQFGKRVKNPWSGGTTSYVCVDIACQMLPSNPEGIDGSWVPEDLRLWCLAHGKPVSSPLT